MQDFGEGISQEDLHRVFDRFYRELEFGTAGLRGVIGAGTNRMNIYTVRQATQGLANYILSQNGQEKGVAIAHDSRIMSTEFADEAALCLNANGIKAYVFDSLRPTPELSFAVRELGCISGIVITASHNPREYNGYKVYWEDGAQITPPHDKNILAEVAKVTSFDQVKTMKKEDAVAAGLYKVIGKEIDDRYMEELKKQFQKMLGEDPLANRDFVRIINRKHYNRLQGLLEGENLLYGGGHRDDPDSDSGWIAPTLVADSLEGTSKPMGEEIFGPILPIIPYDTLDQAIDFIRQREKPLALYLFTQSRKTKERILNTCSFGGGCVNDTIIHLATHHMPFGGVGQSRMGS